SEMANRVADRAVQIFGGRGYMRENVAERFFRELRVDRIWEGTNEINRQIITGYFMKKTLLDEIALREKIREIDTFLESEEAVEAHVPLAGQMHSVEAGKHLILYVFNEALNEFGQDLKHHQQLGETLADSFIDLYAADSTICRIEPVIHGDGQYGVLIPIAQALTAEVSLRLLNRALMGLNDIYHGNLPEKVVDKLRRFQVKMLPRADVATLKCQIAEFVYSQKRYPF
ncbi:MAG: acyl-CoA dehydrogenase family protein, partial [Fidelibacterota bacterium]